MTTTTPGTTSRRTRLLSQRAKVGLVAVAAAVSTLGGGSLANAAPAHITQPQTGPTSYLGGHAPEGTRITGLGANSGHSWADGRGVATEVSVKGAEKIALATNLLTRPSGNGSPPPVAGPARGGMTAQAGNQWIPGRVGNATGVRIRATIPYGTVRGYLPRFGHVWLWCEARASNNTHWFWIAYNTGSRWIYGYASYQYLYPSPDRSIPTC